MIFDVVEVVPEPDNPQTNHKLKLVYSQDQRGPVVAVADVKGFLLTSLGEKTVVHSFDDSERLTAIAFIDTQTFVHNICTIKEYALLGDVHKSIWFARFKSEPPTVNLLGKDDSYLQVYSTEFLIGGTMLNFAAVDSRQNLQLFSYSPEGTTFSINFQSVDFLIHAFP